MKLVDWLDLGAAAIKSIVTLVVVFWFLCNFMDMRDNIRDIHKILKDKK